MMQASGASAQGAIYKAAPTLVRWGADRYGLSVLANGAAAAANAGANLLTGIRAYLGVGLLATTDVALAKGVIHDEAKAVWNGNCY